MNKLELTLEQFSGPLDLLLSLIQDQELAITEVSLSAVTEQYLMYLDTLEKYHPDELADFLVIATRLLLAKSRALLPQFASDEDEGPSLTDQLKLYKEFLDASKAIHEQWVDRSAHAVFRVEPPRKATGFIWPANVDLDALRQRMVQLVNRLAPPKPLPQTYIDKAISMKERIDQIRKLLSSTRQLGFRDMLQNAENKTEVIVSFLAILELVKQRTVALQQHDSFSDIMITRV